MNRLIHKEKEKIGDGTYSIHFYISISVIVGIFFLRGNVSIFVPEVEMKILALHVSERKLLFFKKKKTTKSKKPLSNSTYLA